MKTKVVFFAWLLLIGCDGEPKNEAVVTSVTAEPQNETAVVSEPKTILQKIGIGGPTKEEIAKQQELQAQELQAKKELQAQELQAKKDKLKEGDALVAKWADKVQEKAGRGAGATKDDFGFERTEGLTEDDPWGQQIKVSYHQKGFQEIATIASAGPDGVFGSSDDLTRVRTAKNPLGIFATFSKSNWAWFACWVFFGVLGYFVGAKYGLPAKNKFSADWDKE